MSVCCMVETFCADLCDDDSSSLGCGDSVGPGDEACDWYTVVVVVGTADCIAGVSAAVVASYSEESVCVAVV